MYRHDPGKGHWQAVKWVLWYLLKTLDVGLVFERDDLSDQNAIDFIDSNYVSDLDKWQSRMKISDISDIGDKRHDIGN